MRNRNLSRFATLTLAFAAVFGSFQASPEDIDIFSVDESNVVARPNVLIVLDNSANWSRQSQQWPDGDTQGQSEAIAIKTVINELDPSVNVGLMEFITSGAAADQDSAFVRFHMRPMTAANKATLSNHMDTIFNNINDPDEKRPQSNPFGNLMWDVYNYLAGIDHSNEGDGTLAALADGSAYTSPYKTFQSPLTSADTCTRTVVIFIGNNVSNGPTADSTANVDALKALAGGGSAGDTAVTQIPFADYVVTTTAATDNLGLSAACYTSDAACTTALAARDADGNGVTDCEDGGYLSCSCSATDAVACPSTHWNVVGKTNADTTTILSGPTTTSQANQDTGDIVQVCKNATQGAALNPTTCPAPTDVTQADTPLPGQSTRTQTSWDSCSYVSIGGTGCSGGKLNYQKQGTRTTTITVSETTTVTTTTDLGDSAACYNSQAECGAVNGGFDCSAFNGGCTCTAATTTTGCAAGSTFKFMEQGTYNITAATQTGTFSAAPAGPFMLDEWARFLRQTGVPIPGTDPSDPVRSQVTTYTIDVFNAQQHPDFSGLLFNAARVGGGKYFQAKDQNALINALRQILTEVQAVNSAFSSASLPVNATNRAQNENQVFIGVFKPDRQKRPEWFGNLKRYQLVSSGAVVELGDANQNPAVNEQTGFITDCAESFWTTDSIFAGAGYWTFPITTDPIPESACIGAADSLSDLPDGPFVEKGAVAEVLRKGNDPTATPDGDGNYALNRNVYTIIPGTTAAGDTLPDFDVANTGLDDKLVLFTRGEDVRDEDLDAPVSAAFTEPRSTIHGDVVHSRPQPLNFGGSTGVVVFYGSNDGHYRAVLARTGQELWSFVAPEHFDRLQRLFDNNPNVKFFGDLAAGSEPKDYFFDGSTGVFQTFNSDGSGNQTYIYPSMRRGGYKVYGIDVSEPTKPAYLWSKGCNNDFSDCDAGFEDIAQTWALPNVALIKGYCGSGGCADDSTPRVPVVVFGGGYDTCDDENTSAPCSATRGRGVYVVDGVTGTLLKHFDFSGISGARGVAADVALIDIDNDGMVDYGYAVDTGGGIYRMDFIDGPSTKVALDETKWDASRIAFTADAGEPRKFLFPPALVQATSSMVYLAIGTGDREHPLMSQYPFGTEGDAASAILNRFYVFKDLLSDVDSATVTDLDDTSLMADYTDSNACSNVPVTPGSSLKGWFIDLDAQGQGEQVVTSAVVAAGFVFFSTNRPTPADTTACSTSLGEARGYFLNLLNASGAIGVSGACGGTRSSTFVGGGLPPSPVLATVPIDGELRTVVIGAVQKTGEPSSPIEAQRVRPPIASDRKPIYWYKSTGDK
jgi:Tfp pilus tip-associated adhesin PilY1